MNFLRDNKFKKLSAVFLLSALAFINAVKIFHTHNFSYSTQAGQTNKNATAVKANSFCAICDFQFAKDSDAAVALIHISTPVHFIISYYSYTLPQSCNFSVRSSVRGPPVFVS